MRNSFVVVLWLLPVVLTGALPQDITQAIHPYELEKNHPVRKHLDSLFRKSRVITSLESLKKAGFKCQGPRKHTGLIVAKHKKTPGYIYKIYTDVQEFYKRVPEYQLWLLRVEGAKRIREYVALHQWEDLFKVPTKWIYIIPESSKEANGYYVKYTMLVEEDMRLRSASKNEEMWKGDGISHDLLHRLYRIITDLGLRDCAKCDNIPFCRDGKIAFIDTQTFDAPPVSYQRLTPKLNRTNRQYWQELIRR